MPAEIRELEEHEMPEPMLLTKEERQKTRSLYQTVFAEDSQKFVDFYYEYKIRDLSLIHIFRHLELTYAPLLVAFFWIWWNQQERKKWNHLLDIPMGALSALIWRDVYKRQTEYLTELYENVSCEEVDKIAGFTVYTLQML